jgi:hypothetical protein
MVNFLGRRPCEERSARFASFSPISSRPNYPLEATVPRGAILCGRSMCRSARNARTTPCVRMRIARFWMRTPHHHRMIVWLLRYSGVRMAEAQALARRRHRPHFRCGGSDSSRTARLLRLLARSRFFLNYFRSSRSISHSSVTERAERRTLPSWRQGTARRSRRTTCGAW